MVHIGIDLHKRESQICWLNADTGELWQRRIQTRRDRFDAVLGTETPGQVLIEAGTESEWVAQGVEALGPRVHVVDPGFAPMYPRARRVRHKNDQRDAEALAVASLHGTYRSVYRVSAARRRLRQLLTVRDSLVRTRPRTISMIRAALRSDGLRISGGGAESFVSRVRDMALPPELADVLAPALLILEVLEPELRVLDQQVLTHVEADAVIQR